ncbi:MAG TPA: hypothetical protein VFG78_01310 [Gemmatimonadota bacterium]|nr:hypothetical protein [Gemmatimonadota bacterium]
MERPAGEIAGAFDVTFGPVFQPLRLRADPSLSSLEARVNWIPA